MTFIILSINARLRDRLTNNDDTSEDDESGVIVRMGLDLGDAASTSALTVTPSTVGSESTLNIATIIRSKDTDSNPKYFKKDDCVVFRFNSIDGLPDYTPFPNQFSSCDFESGDISCERLSNFDFKLTLGSRTTSIKGSIGKMLNPPGTDQLSLNRIDYYKDCFGRFETWEDAEADDTSTGSFTIDFSNGVIEDASLTVEGPLIVGHASTSNFVTILFTPGSSLPSPGKIELTSPTWTENFDVPSQQVLIDYYNEDPGFACESPSLIGLDISDSSGGIISVKYESLTGLATDQVIITCSSWRNPIVPGVYGGFYIRTYERTENDQEIVDKSDEFYLDATILEADPIEIASYILDKPIPGELSSYVIEIEADILIESMGYCYVKYTFPPELDVSELNLEDVKGSDMFIDETGSLRVFNETHITHNFDNEDEVEKWIILPGCEFNPMERTEEELINFRQNIFTAQFKNIRNPMEEVDTSQFLIEIYKNFDQETQTLSNLIALTQDDFVISGSSFAITGGEITDASITISGTYLAISEGNIATIQFTPASVLPPTAGIIEVITPHWSNVYDTELKQVIIEYPIGESNLTCTSTSFEILEIIDSSGSILQLAYANFASETGTDTVVIECDNWRSPTVSEVQSGYTIITKESNNDLLDFTPVLSIDATNLIGLQIPDESFQYEMSSPYPSDMSDYTIAFEVSSFVDSDQICFVKYEFPPEVDVSQINLDGIQGLGMLVSETGAIREYSSSEIQSSLSGDIPWIMLEGCVLELNGKLEEELAYFVQNMFIAEFPSIKNPSVAQDLSPMNIQVFSQWDYESNLGSGLIADTTTATILADAYTFIPGTLQDVSFSAQSDKVGDQGSVTIVFTPASLLPNLEGKILIELLPWATTFNAETGQMETQYITDSTDLECSSEAFASTSTVVSDIFIDITYSDLLADQLSEITLTCSNIRNPIVPIIIEGIQITTALTGSYTFIDQATFDFDASNFIASEITYDLFSYEVSSYGSDENLLADYTFIFESPVPVETPGDCYVKYTFPEELIFPDISMTEMDMSGMFVNEQGQAQQKLGVQNSGDNWIAVQGCIFDPQSDSSHEEFVQNQFKITFYNIGNPTLSDTSALKIELFKEWNSETNTGSQLIASNDQFVICSNRSTIDPSSGSCSRCDDYSKPNEERTECITDACEQDRQIVDVNGMCQDCPDYFKADSDNLVCVQDDCGETLVQNIDGTCSECPEYQYPGQEVGTCVADTCNNAIEILLIDGTCSECPPYERPNDDNLACITDVCLETTQIKDITGRCQDCEDYFRADSEGLECVQDDCGDSLVQNIDGTCSECPDYQYPGEEIGTCIQDNCNVRIEILQLDGTCLNCPDYFRPDDDGLNCIQDETCEEFEVRRSFDGQCTRCADHSYPDENLENCISDVCTSVEILTIEGTCAACGSHSYPDEEGKSCISDDCSNNREILHTDGTCEACPDYTMPDLNNTLCISEECLVETQILLINGECETCQDYYKPDENGTTCIYEACAGDSEHFIQIDGTCDVCPDYFYAFLPNEYGQNTDCTQDSCDINQIILIDGTCQSCEQYLRPDTQQKSCISVDCNYNQILTDDQTCQTCEDGYLPDAAKLECIDQAGLEAFTGPESASAASSCTISQYLSTDGSCVDCEMYYYGDTLMQSCHQDTCDHTEEILSEIGRCQKCPTYSYPNPDTLKDCITDFCDSTTQFQTKQGTCTTCPDFTYPNQIDFSCQVESCDTETQQLQITGKCMEKCSDPSKVLRYDSDICETCDDYFYANDDQTECIQDTCGNPILEILSKDGKCTVISTDPELAQLVENYIPTVVEGDEANAIRSHVRMDGTIDDYNNAGGTLEYIANLATSIGIDESQIQIVSIKEGSIIVISDLIPQAGQSLSDISEQFNNAVSNGLNLPLSVLDVATGSNGDNAVEISPQTSLNDPVSTPVSSGKTIEEKKKLGAWVFPAILVGFILIIFIVIKIRSKAYNEEKAVKDEGARENMKKYEDRKLAYQVNSDVKHLNNCQASEQKDIEEQQPIAVSQKIRKNKSSPPVPVLKNMPQFEEVKQQPSELNEQSQRFSSSAGSFLNVLENPDNQLKDTVQLDMNDSKAQQQNTVEAENFLQPSENENNNSQAAMLQLQSSKYRSVSFCKKNDEPNAPNPTELFRNSMAEASAIEGEGTLLGFEHEIIPTVNEEEAFNRASYYYQEKDKSPGLRGHSKQVYFDNEAQKNLEALGLKIVYPTDTSRAVFPTERLFNPNDFVEILDKRAFENNVRGTAVEKQPAEIMQPSVSRKIVKKFQRELRTSDISSIGMKKTQTYELFTANPNNH